MENAESQQKTEILTNRERGKNTFIELFILRHGERTKTGELTDFARTETREQVQALHSSGLFTTELDAIKPIGSDAGPAGPTGSGRARETAELVADELSRLTGARKLESRERNILSYEPLKTPPPYNHTEIYNSFLPDDFESLPDLGKKKAAQVAQQATVNHVLSLDTPQAITWRKENAGALAFMIEHMGSLSGKLYKDSKILIPAGSHDPVIEYILKEALIWEDIEGKKHKGFGTNEEIGGEFEPGEGYSVNIKRNDNGELEPLTVNFKNPKRTHIRNAHFEPDKIHELSEFYKNLHGKKTIS